MLQTVLHFLLELNKVKSRSYYVSPEVQGSVCCKGAA